MSSLSDANVERVHRALNGFQVETPSWGYADTGTRFGKFFQSAAAIDTRDKLADAGQVHAVTGCCPTVAMHILWDFPDGEDPSTVAASAAESGVKLGSMNPNLFQDQIYKLGSLAHADHDVREAAIKHCIDAIEIGKTVDSDVLSLWLADGTNYPGQDSIRARKKRLEAAVHEVHEALGETQKLFVEYKPFEPAFYQSDIADWGMALHLARTAGPKSKVLVDTGHHYLAQNIEQIVAWLLDEGMLGGFHFNDRRYADDDLTLGSVDPYQVFRIFHEIHAFAADNDGIYPAIDFMVDQSHNLKPKIEAMIQTVTTAQDLYAKAALVDHEKLHEHQRNGAIIDAELELKSAFNSDVSGAIEEWRETKGLKRDPLETFRKSGYAVEQAVRRSERRRELGLTQRSSYA